MPLNGKQFGCGHTPKFLQGAGPAKMLVGELPKPAVLRDKLSQSPGALHRSLRPVTIVPGPYFHCPPFIEGESGGVRGIRMSTISSIGIDSWGVCTESISAIPELECDA